MLDTDLCCIGKYVNLYRDLQPAQNVWMLLWGSGNNKGGAKYSKMLYQPLKQIIFRVNGI